MGKSIYFFLIATHSCKNLLLKAFQAPWLQGPNFLLASCLNGSTAFWNCWTGSDASNTWTIMRHMRLKAYSDCRNPAFTPSMTKKAPSKVMTGFTSPSFYWVTRLNVALELSREAESLVGMKVHVTFWYTTTSSLKELCCLLYMCFKQGDQSSCCIRLLLG